MHLDFLYQQGLHAYYSYEKENIIYYKLDNYYAPKYESGIIYNDTSIKVKWPKKK